MARVIAEFQRFGETKAKFPKPFSKLTPRERDILRLLALMASDDCIARQSEAIDFGLQSIQDLRSCVRTIGSYKLALDGYK